MGVHLDQTFGYAFYNGDFSGEVWTSFTLALWVQDLGQGSGAYDRMFDAEYSNGVAIARQAFTQNVWGIRAGDVGPSMGNMPGDGSWTLGVMTYDNPSGVMTLYRDGVQTDQVTRGSSTITLHAFSIGNDGVAGAGDVGSAHEPWPGGVAEGAMWDIALSPTDITALQTNRPSTVQAANLQHYWPLVLTSDLSDLGLGTARNLTQLNDAGGHFLQLDHPYSIGGGPTMPVLSNYYAQQRRQAG